MVSYGSALSAKAYKQERVWVSRPQFDGIMRYVQPDFST